MYQFFDTLTDDSGNALLGATVQVQNYPSGTLATIYNSNGTTSPIANSTVAADITGQVSFYAPDGAYILIYSYKGTPYKTRSPVQWLDPMGFVALSDTGLTANNYVITDSRLPAQKYVGLKLELLLAHTNTGASVLNFQADGGVAINQPGGAALVPGMLQAAGLARFEWDGTQWQLIGSQSQPFYARTLAEIAASVIPASTAFSPDHIGYDVRRTGATGDGATDDRTAILNANAVGNALYFPKGTYRIASSLTITVACFFDGGAVLKPDAGVLISINGSVIAPNQQIFNLSNNATNAAVIRGSLGGVPLIAQWFGVVADGDYSAGTGTDNNPSTSSPPGPLQQLMLTALQRSAQTATNTGANEVYIPGGIYKMSAPVQIGDGISVRGAGKYATVLFVPTGSGSASGSWQVNGAGTVPSTLRSMALIGQVGGANGSGLVSTKNGSFFYDLWVAGFTQASQSGVILNQTDNYLSDSIIEVNQIGVTIKQSDITVSNCKTYQNSVCGYNVTDAAEGDIGRVLLDHCESFQDTQQGFLINSNSRHVSLNSCHCAAPNAASYTTAAFQIDSDTSVGDITLANCTGNLGAQSTVGVGILVSGSSANVNIQGGFLVNFKNGISLNSATAVTVNGTNIGASNLAGIQITGGDQINVSACMLNNNGGDGLNANASAASSKFNVSGCMANNNAAWGFNLTTVATSKINLGICTAAGNTSGSVTTAGAGVVQQTGIL